MDKQTALSGFLDDVIAAKFGQLPPAMASEYKKDLSPRLYKWILLKTMQKLATISEQKLTEFEDLITEKLAEPSEVTAYIENNIPDSPSFLAETLLEFRTAYLGG